MTWLTSTHTGKRSLNEFPASSRKFFLRFGACHICAYNCPTGRVGCNDLDPGEITLLLQQWRTGDGHVGDRLFELLMPDLRKIAGRCFRGERHGHTLQPTALINEAFLRLARNNNIDWQDRGHFLAISARVMRRYLIDHARPMRVDFLPLEGLPERIAGTRTPLELAITIDALLDELEKESQQRREVVELKFFLGLTDPETADALNLTRCTPYSVNGTGRAVGCSID